ncbi:fibronectin type III-like domain-contianing protein [Paenibacillus sp. WC2504]
MRGAEVVQLYIKDMEASVTRRIIECKGFQKVELAPGERKTVIFRLGYEELAIWDSGMQFKVEPGNVKIMVGSDSQHTAETMLHITR